jgi:lipoprotein-releasing system permease protein
MGFPAELALRYMRSKKRAFVSVGTLFAVLGVALGVAALATVMSVTGGFRSEFRRKVLGVNAHVLVLKYTSSFREYRDVMKKLDGEPGVVGIAPFVINPMMVTHKDRTATGVLLKGVDPDLMPKVLDLPKHIVSGSLEGLRLAGTLPPERKSGASDIPVMRRPSAAKELLAPTGPATKAAEEVGRPTPPQEHPSEPLPIPEGSTVPEGGFASTLPDNDVLPAELDTDPCRSAETRAKLAGIVIGRTLGENLNARIGDCLQVTSPTIGYSYSGGQVSAPVAKQFRVIAIFDAGFDQYDSKLVYTDLYEAQAFYDAGDTVTGIEMKVADIDQARAISARIEHKLSNGLYRTMDWEELNHGLFTALRIQQILMSLVLALIIIVAAFTVVATLIMVVLEKKREIAVLKSMGATDSALLRAFVYQGGIVGLLGTVVGLGIGLGVCKGLLVYGFPLDPKVYFISHLPVEVKPEQFVLVGVFAVIVCLIACVWPAMYAAKLRPADAFRDGQ